MCLLVQMSNMEIDTDLRVSMVMEWSFTNNINFMDIDQVAIFKLYFI